MKKLLIIGNILFLGTTLILLYILIFAGTVPVTKARDNRNVVAYPDDLKALVLSEMRDYLEVIHDINTGLAENNPNKIIVAAERQGNASLLDTPKRLLKLSPLACKKMGFKGHHLFQAIADSARLHFNPATTQRQLAALTQNCIICHRSYRIK